AISLDDLGTGYTNFEVLYELPLTSVKIDRSIINITDESRGLEMYKNICELCHDLGYKIILEGVETQSQVDRLVDDKTYAVQGWYYSKAVPFADIIPLVQQIKNRLHSEGTNPLPVHS
ncbi:MAG: EAL domain-containing protein, partial [Pseudomonadales bacterium]